jgi:polysaccharide export outer membrane protein
MTIMNKFIFATLTLVFLQSCAFRKDILYLQDIAKAEGNAIKRDQLLVQSNDILQITINSLLLEAASPYNNFSLRTTANNANSIDMVKLQGYLVSVDGAIELPILGRLIVLNKPLISIEKEIKELLVTGGHLVNPTVTVRVVNSKVTVLGEVNRPGTYSFMEETLTVPQVLGYAGDLTINGDRKEVLLIRESNGIRTVKKINLTQSNWINDPTLQIRQNDVIVVHPNIQKIKTAGLIGNTGTILTIASLILSSIILITR